MSGNISKEEALTSEVRGVSPEVAAIIAKNRLTPSFSPEQKKSIEDAINGALAPIGDAMYAVVIIRPMGATPEKTSTCDAILVGHTPGLLVADDTPLIGGMTNGVYGALLKAAANLK